MRTVEHVPYSPGCLAVSPSTSQFRPSKIPRHWRPHPHTADSPSSDVAAANRLGSREAPQFDLPKWKRYGYESKAWYLVNPKIAGKWMFIPLKMYL